MVTSADLLAAALRYAELGYRVFPCVPNGKAPLTAHGFHDAVTDAEQVARWWSQHPLANIGIAAKGLLVVDVDGKDNPWPGDLDRAADLATAGAIAQTPRGGRHFVFRRPPRKAWKCSQGAVAPGIDVRTDGGYVVAAPSVTPDGAYAWGPDLGLMETAAALPEPPVWLMELLDVSSDPRTVTLPASPNGENKIPTGQRNATLARLAGSMRRVGMTRAEIAAALVRANEDRCEPPLSGVEVARIAASIARYEPDAVTVALAENHYHQMVTEPPEPDDEFHPSDPGPVPVEWLRVPGFVSELMDHCLATAPYPNVTLAFAGAMVLQAFLAGRKVRDPGDNRTNLYLLGLANSSAGKDWPRKLNTEIAHRVGLADGIGDKFASGEGVQDALSLTPCMLFQTDEIDGLLQSINRAKDGRHESIMGTLLTLYSSASTVYPLRRKAGRESPGGIDQPCLSVFGTAIPNHFYAAMSERMLTNGLFARMIVLESGPRGAGQEPRIRDIPPRLLAAAAWWADFRPGTGNLQAWHPVPAVVEQTPEAGDILVAGRRAAEAEYDRAAGRDDDVGTTVWGRVSEQSRKLALLYAVSAARAAPRVDRAAAEWAVRVATHQARRMLAMAGRHVSETEFDQRCKRVVAHLAAWRTRHGDAWMPYRDLGRRLRWSRRDHDEVREALVDQERIETGVVTTAGRPRIVYRLRGATGGSNP